MVGGVAAGFADYFNVDPVFVRLGFVLLALANGIGLLFYVICWVIVPTQDDGVAQQTPAGEHVVEEAAAAGVDVAEEARGAGEQVAEEARAAGERIRAAGENVVNEVRDVAESGRGHMIAGVILIVVGSVFLLDRFAWMFHWPRWLSFENLLPLVLVAIGVRLLMRAREERA